MAEYYRNIHDKRVEKKSSRSLLMVIFDLLMFIVSIATIVIILFTYIAPYINPKAFWILSLLGLFAPATYFLTFLLLLYWVVRYKWNLAMVFVILVGFGLFYIPLFYKFGVKREYNIEQSQGRGTFKIISYNVRSFYGEDGESSVGDIIKLIEKENPDIICFQEYNVSLAKKNADFSALLKRYDSAIGISKTSVGAVTESPLVIYSKYDILKSGSSLINRDTVDIKTAIWADVLIGKDTIRIFNNHLHSTHITASDNDFITNYKYLSDSTSDDKVMSMIHRFRDNSIARSAEVDEIAQIIDATKHQKIVVGDFNDTPMSYVYRTMAYGMDDAFSESGQDYSYTYRGFYNILRIDYILSSESIVSQSYDVLEDVNYSDHLPVIVRFKIDKN